MRRGGKPIIGLVLVLVAASGCVDPRTGAGSSASVAPAAPPSIGMTPAPSPSPSPAPTHRPSRTPLPRPTPDIPHVDPGLEAYLPASIGGAVLEAVSVEASEIAATVGGDFYPLVSPYDVLGLAEQLGLSTDDMTVAITGSREVRVLIYAYGVPGVRAKRILSARHAMGGMNLNEMAALLPLTWLAIAGRRVAYLPTSDVSKPTSGEYDLAWDGVLVSILGEALGDDGTVPAAIVAAVEALPDP